MINSDEDKRLKTMAMTSDSLQGKWLAVSSKNTYLVPYPLIFEFAGKEILVYHYRELQPYRYELSGNDIFKRKELLGTICMISTNRFKLRKMPVVFVRLLPTRSGLPEAKIRQLKFTLEHGKKKLSLSFTDNTMESSADKFKPRFALSTIDRTFFVEIRSAATIETLIPIKEITEHSLALYGFYDHPYNPVAHLAEDPKA